VFCKPTCLRVNNQYRQNLLLIPGRLKSIQPFFIVALHDGKMAELGFTGLFKSGFTGLGSRSGEILSGVWFDR